MKTGFASVDITPPAGLSLAGFIARQNKPSERFADPLYVRCLAIGEDEDFHLLFSYDLLGIGKELQRQITAALAAELGSRFSPSRTVFAATHTHSAPATVRLEGCGVFDDGYWQKVVRASVKAARAALDSRAEAALRFTQRRINGLTYNRRRVLEDGQVSMAIEPTKKVVSQGPVDEWLTILGWYDARGRCIAAAIHFAAHPICNGSLVGTADFPGELCRRVEAMLGAPCLFLQGAAGDINPVYIAQSHKETVLYGRRIAEQLDGIVSEMRPVADAPLRSIATSLPLAYDRNIDTVKWKRELEQFELLASWNPDAPGAAKALRAMADLMNCDPDDVPDPGMHAFNARTLAMTMRRTLEAVQHEIPPCPLSLAVWSMGDVVLVFAGAELFAQTGLDLKKLVPVKVCLPVGYCAPLVGYLPTRQAVKLGGYEADYAWRYYGHPAPFAADSEERVRAMMHDLLSANVSDA